MSSTVRDFAAAVAPRIGKVFLSAVLLAASNGCASLKNMTADFDRKWDDPKSILNEMDRTAEGVRAVDSSSAAMSAQNSNDCARKNGLTGAIADDLTLAARRIAAGECLLESNKPAEAAELFASAAEHGGALALQGRGVALVRLQKYREAADVLAASKDADPTLWRAWNAYGVAADYLGYHEDAVASFTKAAELNPDDGAALNNLGVSLLKSEKRDEAVAAFKRALERDGAREAAEANLRLAYAMGGDYSGSVRALPDNRKAAAYNNAGVAAAARGDKSEARRLLTRAIEISPHFYAKAYANLAILVE